MWILIKLSETEKKNRFQINFIQYFFFLISSSKSNSIIEN